MRTTPYLTAAGLGLALLALAGGPSSTQASQRACRPANPPSCLYVPERQYTAGVVDGIVLTDPARGDYPIPLLVRYPREATGRRPVVLWNHGGNPSVIGRNRSEEWGTALARAGYVVIQPSRVTPADITPLRAECEANGVADPAECGFFIANMRYGPQSTHFLIDHLADIEAADPALGGRLDASTVVVAGHSAGTTTVLANAGARQQFVAGGPIVDERDPRPVAFLATGPQGPTYAGFHAGFDEVQSFTSVDRPFLFITGAGDETGEPVPTRLTAFLTALPGQKTLAWDSKREAVHETMDVHQCSTPLQADHCRWLTSLGIAYLDSVVRHRPAATSWLASDAFHTATGGAIDLFRR